MFLDFDFLTEEAYEYIEILKFDVTIKKIKNLNSSKIKKFRPIPMKFSITHHSVLVHLRTKCQLDKLEFAWVRKFWKNSQKIQNLKKIECFSRFGQIQYQSSLIYIIYSCVVLGR